MAAPAQLPEFQGNGAAILTEQYWDCWAKAKYNGIHQQAKKLAKEGTLPPAQEAATLAKMRAEGLTEREREVIDKGISNFEFRYLGSAKILGGIGRGLCEAMLMLPPPPAGR